MSLANDQCETSHSASRHSRRGVGTAGSPRKVRLSVPVACIVFFPPLCEQPTHAPLPFSSIFCPYFLPFLLTLHFPPSQTPMPIPEIGRPTCSKRKLNFVELVNEVSVTAVHTIESDIYLSGLFPGWLTQRGFSEEKNEQRW